MVGALDSSCLMITKFIVIIVCACITLVYNNDSFGLKRQDECRPLTTTKSNVVLNSPTYLEIWAYFHTTRKTMRLLYKFHTLLRAILAMCPVQVIVSLTATFYRYVLGMHFSARGSSSAKASKDTAPVPLSV